MAIGHGKRVAAAGALPHEHAAPAAVKREARETRAGAAAGVGAATVAPPEEEPDAGEAEALLALAGLAEEEADEVSAHFQGCSALHVEPF